jgi:hypothetical protein
MANKSFQEFLRALIAYESGIDPANFAKYKANGTISYPKVSAPGVVERDKDGNFVYTNYTYDEYFVALGVGELWAQAKTKTDERDWGPLLGQMQYQSTNFLGFVGYQVGESALIETGYYIAATEQKDGKTLAAYYTGDTPNSAFANGVREIVRNWGPDTQDFISTDHNRWAGTFTKKNGVNSRADLGKQDQQNWIVRDVLADYYRTMLKGLGTTAAERRKTLTDFLATPHRLGKDTTDTTVTLSGLLAATWLVGATGTAKMILTGQVPSDETGTSAADYLRGFSGYDTLLDDGSQFEYLPDKYTSTVIVGWPTTTFVQMGGAVSTKVTVLLHDHPQGNSTVDFAEFVYPGLADLPGHRISYQEVPQDRRPVIKGDQVEGGVVQIKLDSNGALTNYTYLPMLTGGLQALRFNGGFAGHAQMTEAQFRTHLRALLVVPKAYELLWFRTTADKEYYREISGFDPSMDQFTPPGTSMSFSNLSMTQQVGYTLLQVIDKENVSGFGYHILGIEKTQITADNFDGVSGSFTEIKNQKFPVPGEAPVAPAG